MIAGVADPVGFGLVQPRTARRERSRCGIVIIDLSPNSSLPREAVRLAPVGTLSDPSSPTEPPRTATDRRREAVRRGWRSEPVGVRRTEEFEDALLAMTRQRAGALIVVSDIPLPSTGTGLPTSRQRHSCR